MNLPKNDCKPCHAANIGKPWAILPEFMESAVVAYNEGRLPLAYEDGIPESNTTPYAVEDGVAIISIDGPMMKGRSKFGGASTLDARERIREAMRDDKVGAVLLRIDSPGGHVAGTQELFNDIKRLSDNKPTHAFIEDLGASAAYWAAVGARSVSANETAQVGSIGVYTVLEDLSGVAEKRGIKVHVVATGDLKGGGARGAALTDGVKDEARKTVESMGAIFFQAVRSRRAITDSDWADVSRGGVFLAREAMAKGLIDQVESIDEAYTRLRDRAKAERARTNLKRGF